MQAFISMLWDFLNRVDLTGIKFTSASALRMYYMYYLVSHGILLKALLETLTQCTIQDVLDT